MTRSVGLVLVGTAALMLGMPGGCDDRGSSNDGNNADPNNYGQGYSSTQPSRNSSSSSSSHHYYSSGRRSTSGGWWYSSHSGGGSSSSGGSHSSGSSSSHTSRGGFGSTGHHVAS